MCGLSRVAGTLESRPPRTQANGWATGGQQMANGVTNGVDDAPAVLTRRERTGCARSGDLRSAGGTGFAGAGRGRRPDGQRRGAAVPRTGRDGRRGGRRRRVGAAAGAAGAAGSGGARPDAARHVRPGRLPPAAGQPADADRDADRAGRGVGPGARRGTRRRRLRDQAVLAPGAGAAGGVGAAPRERYAGRRGAGNVPGRGPRGGHGRSGGPARRCRAGADGARVRPAGVPARAPRAGVLPRRAAGTGLGLDVRRPVDGDRARAAAAGEGRGGPGGAAADRHRVGRRVPVRGRAVTRDQLQVVLIAAACSVPVGLAGTLALRLLRRRSITTNVSAVVLVAVLSVVAGVLGTAEMMFLSSHDFGVVITVVVVAGAVGLAAALALGRRLARQSVWEREAAARERALEASRRELVAWVSHDLRTPLAGLGSDAVATVSPGAAAKRVEARAAPGDWPTVVGSDTELGRVVRNLLANAIRHTPSDGAVLVAAGADADGAWLAVQDSCGGIPADDLPRVFDVAFRGEAARSKDGGAGLGLAIARGLVEAHRGQIAVQNVAPGCRFVVRLPVA